MQKRARPEKENRKRYVVAIALLSLFLFFTPLPSFAAVEGEYVEWDIPVDVYRPPIPKNLSHSYANFFINHTWEPDDPVGGYAETDSFNTSYQVNTNQYWDNSTNTSLNRTVGAHGWLNISQLWAYNTSYTNLSDGYIYQNAQLPNNPITITNTSGWSGDEDELVYLDFDYTDADGDSGSFTTNATKGALTPSTGVFEWQTTMADDGIYHWWFKVEDGYGSSDSYTATITVNDLGVLVNMTSWYNNYTKDDTLAFVIPYTDEDNRTVLFNVTADQAITTWYWYENGVLIQSSDANNITRTWYGGGIQTIMVYGVNANGQTVQLSWVVDTQYTDHEIAYLGLLAAQDANLAQRQSAFTWIFLILLIINFILVFFTFRDTHDIFYGDSVVSIGSIIVSFLAVILSFILARRSLIEPILMPELNYFLLAIALVMVVLSARFIIQVGINTFYAMKAKTY